MNVLCLENDDRVVIKLLSGTDTYSFETEHEAKNKCINRLCSIQIDQSESSITFVW